MSDLKSFAAFVKEEKLEDFVTSNLTMLLSFNIPLMALFTEMPQEELRARTREGLVRFLNSLIDGNAIEVSKISLREWDEDKIPGIPKSAISVTDLTQIIAAQKISLITFIPSFSSDSFASINIVFELELYYAEVRQLSLDILKKIENEEKVKLQESEERYKDLFDNSNDLIHIVSPKGEILYVNKAWQKSLQYTQDDLKGMKIFQVIASRELHKYESYRNKLLNNENDEVGINSVFVAKDGTEISVEGYITCRFKDGIPQYTRGILKDITRTKHDAQKIKYYNEQLAEREENLNLLIQNAPDAIVVIDETNIIQLWNPKAEMIFGWKAEDVLQTNLTNTIIPHEYRASHNNGMKRFKATGFSQVINRTIEITALHKKGNEFNVSLTISQSRQAGKAVFIAFIRDITTQKQNEAELENKRKQLEKSNEELEQYAWLASHDLKEPLRKIMTFSDILITRYKDQLPEVVQKHLSKIHDSTKRMDSLIEAIMVYSNVTDKDDLFIKTDLNQIAKEVIGDLEIAIKNKKAVITIDDLPVIDAIKIQMRQLIQNLISNAIKYSKPETPPIVNVTSEIKYGICSITVTDNGIGFHSQYSEKIFQVFRRLSTGERYEGTGIGLALCKKIVETHNGTIYAESTEGEGAVFHLTLPLKHN